MSRPVPMSQLIGDLRLIEREDGGSTREPGSIRAELLASEIDDRLTYLRAFLANADDECRCPDCFRKAVGHVLDGGEPW